MLTISPVLIKVNNGHKVQGKKKVKGHNLKRANQHSLRDVCLQYENNPANAFRDINWKRNISPNIN